MFALFVTIRTLPGRRDELLALTAANHAGSLAEPRCRRFDVLTDRNDPDLAYLYEIYHDEADLAAHKTTAHYQAWNAAVAPLLAQPRSAVRMDLRLPAGG